MAGYFDKRVKYGVRRKSMALALSTVYNLVRLLIYINFLQNALCHRCHRFWKIPESRKQTLSSFVSRCTLL